MQSEFGGVIQKVSDSGGGELSAERIYSSFEKEYLQVGSNYELKSFNVVKRHFDKKERLSNAQIWAELLIHGKEMILDAIGNGPLDAFCTALREGASIPFTLESYHEHALTGGSAASAVSYIMIRNAKGREFWGAGMDTDIIVASIRALLSALNRSSLAG
jgi:2-isopropylmalate synthase